MPKSTRWRRSARYGGAGDALITLRGPRPAPPAPSLSREARQRLAMLDWHERHGRSVARTARHFGFSRPTVYRWLARYDRLRLESLEDRPSRPVRRRRPTWTLAELVAVRRVRLAYPRWGKDKLRVLLRREGLSLSTSMVGRILDRLRRTGELREPARRGISARRRAWRRPHAVRKPAGFVAARPGDLVQVDTLDVREGFNFRDSESAASVACEP